MLTIPRDDQIGAPRHWGGNNLIVIDIPGYHAWNCSRFDQLDCLDVIGQYLVH